MLLTRSSASADAGSRAFGVDDPSGEGCTGGSIGVDNFESAAAESQSSRARRSLAWASSSALLRHMFSILASLRGPHLWNVSCCSSLSFEHAWWNSRLRDHFDNSPKLAQDTLLLLRLRYGFFRRHIHHNHWLPPVRSAVFRSATVTFD